MSFSVSNQNGSQQSQIGSVIASIVQQDKAAGETPDQIKADIQAKLASLGIKGKHKGEKGHHPPSPEIQQDIQLAGELGIDAKSYLKNHDVAGLENAIAQAQNKQQKGNGQSNPFAAPTVGLASNTQPQPPSILGPQLSGIA